MQTTLIVLSILTVCVSATVIIFAVIRSGRDNGFDELEEQAEILRERQRDESSDTGITFPEIR